MTPDSQMLWTALIQTFPTLLRVGGFFLAFQMLPAFLFALGTRRFSLARWFVILAGLGAIFSIYTVSLFNFFLDARLPAPFYFSLVLTGFVIGFALILLSPFSPSIIAFSLRSPKRWLVFGLNVALLCTIVGPLGLLYLAMARPKVIANAQPVSPDSVESAALNTVTDTDLLKEVSQQSSEQALATGTDGKSTGADQVEQSAEQKTSAELDSKPIAQVQQEPTTDIATAQESQSLAAAESDPRRWAAPDAAADQSNQATAEAPPSSQTQPDSEPAQDQSQEAKTQPASAADQAQETNSLQLPGANQSETAQVDKGASETSDQAGETIVIESVEKKVEES